VAEVLINKIIRTRTRYFRHPYDPTSDIVIYLQVQLRIHSYVQERYLISLVERASLYYRKNLRIIVLECLK
jgi:hypothetical protein